MANFLVWVVWFFAAFACLVTALAVVSFTNPFYSALSLIGNLASLAVLFLLLSGEFVAAGQVLVYGGAVMGMFLFVIACTATRTASRSASAARSAPPPARPTASASSRPRTPPTTGSRQASAMRGSTRST